MVHKIAAQPSWTWSVGFFDRDGTPAAYGLSTNDAARRILSLSKIHCLLGQAAKLINHMIKIRVHGGGAMGNACGIPLHKLHGTYSQHCCSDVNSLRSRTLDLSESRRCPYRLCWDQTENSSKCCMPGFECQSACRCAFDHRVVHGNGQPTVYQLASDIDELPMFSLLELDQSQLMGCLSEVHGSETNRPSAKSRYDRSGNCQRLVGGDRRNQRSCHEEAKRDAQDHRGGKVYAIEYPLHFLASLLWFCDWRSLPLGNARRLPVRQKATSRLILV